LTVQGVENDLGSSVLPFGEPLAYLAYHRPGTFPSSVVEYNGLTETLTFEE
jgi:hypothetical protein